jgi:hypothetical protein
MWLRSMKRPRALFGCGQGLPDISPTYLGIAPMAPRDVPPYTSLLSLARRVSPPRPQGP